MADPVKYDIHDIVEVIDALELLIKTGKEVFADGLDISDLKALVTLATQYDVFVKAAKDIDLVVPEAKDLDASEISTLMAKVFEVINVARA